MSEEDGGSAFPSDPAFYGDKTGPGMSLRDYFAGQALAGWVAGLGAAVDDYSEVPKAFVEHQNAVAESMYGYADAMLREREK